MGIKEGTRDEGRSTAKALHLVCCSCANADVSCYGRSDIREKPRLDRNL